MTENPTRTRLFGGVRRRGYTGSTAIDSELLRRRDEILELARRRGVKNVRVFGSRARGDGGLDSDADFLVDLDDDRTLIDLGALWIDLEELLGFPVDLATEDGLHWYIKERVLREAVAL